MSTEADPRPPSAPTLAARRPSVPAQALPVHPPRTAPLPPTLFPGPGGPTTPEPDPAPTAARARGPVRTVAAAVCLVLGVGLIGGAVAGGRLAEAPGRSTAAERNFAEGRTLWRTVPVDELFPRSVRGAGAGPGGADRRWTRVGVAPDGDCAGAFDAPLARALAPAGCARLLRATYTDATSTTVTTVGLLVTAADEAGMRALRTRFTTERLAERTDLMPRPYAPPGTVAERFGDAQRVSWHIGVLVDAPAVVYAVTGFADGRADMPPQPAAQAVAHGATTAPAQAGLGHDASALAERMETALRRALRAAAREDER
ncbi:hypothetical protein [Streptomyces albireticuli]|uniref:hypothetical protein n=1 Tax=Streptomyces albireticuli TaxID=1940 RepID=UPI001E4FAB6A|nr:hypothetical protein [Streptomyces albireticuli]MCD9143378.1 hypothetical protein [Streptomyces albireticuli]MCD9164737.1 hypothetical protein [Streptomyces albireticuli]MCD9191495.1 hypothetical protein [Streptomyces albireticuli]